MKATTVLSSVFLAVLLPACSGRVAVAPVGSPVWYESEPNDFASNANWFGSLRPGDQIIIDGRITGECCDPFDGFAFVSDGPILVEFYLDIFNPAADLDVCIYDAFEGATVLCFDRPGTLFEDGAFEVIYDDAEFHFVVSTYDFPSDYRLEINAYPLYAATAAPELAPGSALRSRSPEALQVPEAAPGSKPVQRHRDYFTAREPEVVEDVPVAAIGTALLELSDGTVIEQPFAVTEDGTALPIEAQ